jgi:hypothetical protein
MDKSLKRQVPLLRRAFDIMTDGFQNCIPAKLISKHCRRVQKHPGKPPLNVPAEHGIDVLKIIAGSGGGLSKALSH